MTKTKETLDDFLSGKYGDHPTTVIDVEKSDKDHPSPFIVIRAGRFAVVINPLALTGSDNPDLNHLSVDVHSFVDGVEATGGVFGMTNGRRFRFNKTGTKSHGWESAALVAVLVGEQDEEEAD
jgi:hypothetical protein